MKTLLYLAAFISLAGCREASDQEPTPWPDIDNDGYTADLDCDDTMFYIHPGAQESCDSKDNDCDGEVDENAVNYCYLDNDEDNWPVPEYSWTNCAPYIDSAFDGVLCVTAPWDMAWDCNDNNSEINPGSSNPNYDCETQS